MEIEEAPKQTLLPSELVQEITELAFQLNAQRKDRKKLKERAFVDFKDQ